MPWQGRLESSRGVHAPHEVEPESASPERYGAVCDCSTRLVLYPYFMCFYHSVLCCLLSPSTGVQPCPLGPPIRLSLCASTSPTRTSRPCRPSAAARGPLPARRRPGGQGADRKAIASASQAAPRASGVLTLLEEGDRSA